MNMNPYQNIAEEETVRYRPYKMSRLMNLNLNMDPNTDIVLKEVRREGTEPLYYGYKCVPLEFPLTQIGNQYEIASQFSPQRTRSRRRSSTYNPTTLSTERIPRTEGTGRVSELARSELPRSEQGRSDIVRSEVGRSDIGLGRSDLPRSELSRSELHRSETGRELGRGEILSSQFPSKNVSQTSSEAIRRNLI
jgi:hypothetical protein